jgi:hypothetical protein
MEISAAHVFIMRVRPAHATKATRRRGVSVEIGIRFKKFSELIDKFYMNVSVLKESFFKVFAMPQFHSEIGKAARGNSPNCFDS